MPSHRAVWIICIVGAIALSTAAIGTAYTISPDQSVDIQPKTIEIQNDEDHVPKTAYVDVDDELTYA